MLELSLQAVAEITSGRLVGDGHMLVRGVSTDTRAMQGGELFVALRGERHDGHDFVAAALAGGAAGALVSRQVGGAGLLVVVQDTLAALGALAAAHRRGLRARVIGITGSTGKTTTKEMAAAILSQGRRTARSPGNYNNEIGVPLALLAMGREHEAAVLELAMRAPGEIAYLAQMARPQVGVVTNIGVSHLELLGTREAIARAKAELLEALPPEGMAVLNADDDFFGFLRERSSAQVVSFGAGPEAQVRVEGVRVGAQGRLEFTLAAPWGRQRIALRAAGRHQALNAAAAAAAAVAAGADPEWVPGGLAAFEGAEMRGRIVEAPGGYTVVDDCYNAAPDSMRVALELLADLPGGRKWAVLGDMKELGPLATEWHREVGELAAALGLAGVVTVGELGREIARGARGGLPAGAVVEAEDNASAAAAARARLAPCDVVLVKGSRAMQMEEVVKALLEGTRGV